MSLVAVVLLVGLPSIPAAAGSAPGAPSPKAAPQAIPEAPGGWLDEIQEGLSRQEYEATWQPTPALAGLEAAWHAPNRAHGFRSYFTDAGLRLVPRLEATPSWTWGLSLHSYTQGEASFSLPSAASASASGPRVEYRHAGSIEEWYENSPRGLEHGFVLPAPPAELVRRSGGNAEDLAEPDDTLVQPASLHVNLALWGDLSPIISEDAQYIDFVTPSGARVLRYAELKVTDARGDLLPAWMEGFAVDGVRGIRLAIDASEAVYPITVDPLATSPAWTAESNQAGAGFGLAVATAGDVNDDGYSDVIVGAWLYDNGQTDEGRAFVYHGSASGPSFSANWTAESDQAGAQFGFSAATAGDVNNDGYSDVISGAPSIGGGQGFASVYLGSSSGLAATPAWTVVHSQVNSGFGYAVGTAGDVNGDGRSDVIVGARHFTNGQSQEGGAFVYHGAGLALSTTANWSAEGNQASAIFGNSVGTAGDVNGDGFADVIVGAYGIDNDQTNEGRAYVYHGSSGGLSPSANWTAEGNQEGALLGIAVGTAGDVNGDGYSDVIVGAFLFENGQSDEGRALVYHGSGGGLSGSSAWTVEGDVAGAFFGAAVGTAGDVNGDGYADVIVGAYGYANGQAEEGRSSVYLGSSTGLALGASWTIESDQASAHYGESVGTAGDVNGDGYSDVIVGASQYDNNGQTDQGRAFVYWGGPSGPATTAEWVQEGNQAGGEFARSVATAGDVNGDGYADVIVGAPFYDNGQGDEGAAFVYHGSASGLFLTPVWTSEGEWAGASFGFSVATAGDVNGDGFSDVIVGAYGYDNGELDEGRAAVYHGSAFGLSSTFAWTAESNQPGAQLGVSVGTAGDVNGDGFADVIVGAPNFDNGQGPEGRASVYHGSSSGLSPTPAWIAETDTPTDFSSFGVSVGTAGDVNGDGYADVIVGAPNFDSGRGRAFVYHGSGLGLSPSAAWIKDSTVQVFLGGSVGTAGDVNGDGYADVIVTSNGFDASTAGGVAIVHHGSSAGLSPPLIPDWQGSSSQSNAFFGSSAGTAGDINGDGYADVIVGARQFENGQTYEGRAFIYHGSAVGLSATSNWTAEGNQDSAFFAWSVGTAGDVNGDGYADVLVGAPGSGQFNEGTVFLYHGNGGAGLSLAPRQRRADNTAPIARMGVSDSLDGFRLAALGRTPFGRGLVKLEWEVKPLGTPLNGTGIQSGSDWLDTGTAGVALNELVSGLSSGNVHHWRLRLRYQPVATPFQSRSRWLTVPWNGWQEGDLRTPAAADLAVSQSDSSDPILFGSGNVTYEMSVTNFGPNDAPAILTATLPPGTLFVSATPSQGICAAPVSGTVVCALGSVLVGGGVNVDVIVTPQASGLLTSTASVWFAVAGTDPNSSNNASSETTSVLPRSLGDRVWEDTDQDGIQGSGEPGVADVLVALYSGAGVLLDVTFTDGSGAYEFPNLTLGASYRVRFVPPVGSILTMKDQGADDLLDSDADPVTQLTPVFTFASTADPFRWDAGLVSNCQPPDEPIFISMVTLSIDGNAYPILHYQDANQPAQVTGYNVYRSSNPSLPVESWTLVASDVIDMDEGTPNNQWVDTSGDVPPGGLWFYQVTAFNSACPAEGPF